MPLLVYNLTAAPLVLANGVNTIVPPSGATEGVRGKPWYASGNEMQGRSAAQYQALQAQRAAGLVAFSWSNYAEYPTPGLIVELPYAIGSTSLLTAEDGYPVLVKTAVFDEPADGEQGIERSIEIMNAAPYKFRILQVFCSISRGAPGAHMYLCCHPLGTHEPHSDRFDASQAGQYIEQASIHDRIIEQGEDMLAFCSNDFVRGTISFMYQRID